jgi:hypothetical protein
MLTPAQAALVGALACSAVLAVRAWERPRWAWRANSPGSSAPPPRTTTLLGTPVTLLVASTVAEISEHVGALLRGGPTCLGLDAEWRPERSRQGRASPVAVLQLASEDVVVVLQLLRATDGGRHEVPPILRELLAAPHIAKVGVGIHDDAQRLHASFGLECRGCLDLRAFHQDQTSAGTSTAPGLKVLAEHVGIPVGKEHEVRVSDWQGDTLTDAQVQYAAEDALIALLIFQRLTTTSSSSSSLHWAFRDERLGGWNGAAHPWHECPHLMDVKFKIMCTTKTKNSNATAGAGSIRGDESSGEREGSAAAGGGGGGLGEVVRRGGEVLKKRNKGKLKDPSRMEARQSELYHNCMLLDPNGNQLCNIKRDRVMWYISRGLADLRHKDHCPALSDTRLQCACMQDPDVAIQLRFQPKGRGHEGNEYYLAPKKNECVVCAADTSLLRYSVVPHHYRRHMPEYLKSRSSHDIVLMCVSCHQIASFHADTLRAQLAQECGVPRHVSGPKEDADRKRARSYATALLSARAENIPRTRRIEMFRTLRVFHEGGAGEAGGEGEEVAESILREIANLKCFHETRNEEDVGGAQASQSHLIVAAQSDLHVFIRRWRSHFVESMQPQYLP